MLAWLEVCACVSAWADVDENGLTPTHWYKFNGNTNSSGSVALSFGGEYADSYVYSQRDKAYLFKSGCQPYGSGMSRGSGDFTVVTIAKTADLDHGMIWTQGTTETSRGFGLLMVGTDKVAVRTFSSDNSWDTADIITATVADATTRYHTYTLVYTNADKTFTLYVDDDDSPVGSGTVRDSASSGFPNTSFQLGSLNGGLKYDMTQGYGASLDEYRLYQRALTVDQIKRICVTGEKTVTWGTAGTAGDGVATSNDGGFHQSSWTFNFSKDDNIVNGGVSTNRTLRIRKIRLMQRSNKSEKPSAATLTQGTVSMAATSVTSSDEETGMTLYGSNGAPMKTWAYHEFVFPSNVEFDPKVNVVLSFGANVGCWVMKPANSVMAYNGWSPVIEITASQFSDGTAYSTSIGTSTTFSDIEWMPPNPESFSANDALTITNTATTATLTLDEDITVGKMTVVSAEGKMLTFKKNAGVETAFGALDFSGAVEGVGFDARTAGFSAGTVLLDYARMHDEKFYFYGSGANGVTLDYGVGNVSGINGHLVFSGGTHVFTWGMNSSEGLFSTTGTLDNPTLLVTDEATLNFTMRDMCGWNGSLVEGSIIRVADGATMNLLPKDDMTMYMRGRLVLEPGSTTTYKTGNGDFKVYGGDSAATDNAKAQFYVPAPTGEDTVATFSKDAQSTKDINFGKSASAITVENGATLEFDTPVTGDQTVTKYGDGTFRLLGAASGFTGTFAVSAGTFEIAGAATLANGATLAVKAGATLKIDAGDGVFTNRCAMTNNGTIEVTGGTVVFAPGWNGTIVENGGKVIWGYTVTVNDLGKFAIPEGKAWDEIAVFDTGGTALPITNHDATHVYFDWEITGSSCWWDYEFDGNLNNSGVSGHGAMTKWGADPTYTDDNQSLYIHARPALNLSDWPVTATFVTYGKMVSSNNTYQIAFGSINKGSNNTIFLATGDVSKDEVKLCRGSGTACTELCTMTVPNAQTADHLYAFVLKSDGAQSIIDIYLDGKLLQSYPFGSIVTLGNGFQIGSPHGGNVSGYKQVVDNDPATLDWLRVYNLELSNAAMAKYAKEYPYVSVNGKATRTFSGNSTWTLDDAWTQMPYQGEAYPTNRPSAKSMVAISAAVESEVTFDLDEAANYETFDVTDGSPIALRTGGTVRPSVSGATAVGANLTLDYDAISFSGPISVLANKTLTFDFRSLDATNQFVGVTNALTGMVTLEDGAKVEGINLAQPPGRVVEFVQNESTGQYELRIAVLPFVYTIEGEGPGAWTWGTNAVTEAEVDAIPSLPIWKEGSGTLLKALTNRNYVVNGGTLKADQMNKMQNRPLAGIEVNAGGTFDYNGKYDGYLAITLNGGTLVNNGASIGTGARQMQSLSLGADSVVGGSGNFGLIADGWGANTIALGGHVLTKDGGNTFYLLSTTVTGAGAIDIRSGIIEVYRSSQFSDGTTANAGTLKIANAGTLKIDAGQTFTVGRIVGTGGTIENAGTLGDVTLGGSVTLGGTGTYGTNTLAGAVVNVQNLRNLVFAGTGTVNVTLTAAEVGSTDPINVFTAVAGANVSIGKILDPDGNDITANCRLQGGAITVVHEAKIGTTLYATLGSAMAHAGADDTVVLLVDVAFSGEMSRACTIDLAGNALTVSSADVTANGTLEILNSSGGAGRVAIADSLAVSGGSECRLILSAPTTNGTIVVENGTLAGGSGEANYGGTGIRIGQKGVLDLSVGTSVSCHDFAIDPGGSTYGTTATLIVKGVLDASGTTEIGKLELTYGATLKGTGLVVSDLLTLGDYLKVEADETQAKIRLATVPNDGKTYETAVSLNGTPGYGIYQDGTRLYVVKEDSVVAHVVVDTAPGTNFEVLEVKGEVSDWHGGETHHGKTNVYVIARSESTGVSITQKVDYVVGPSGSTGSFEAAFDGVSAGDTYTVSAYVKIDGVATEAASTNADVVTARSVGGWIYENAATFAGQKPSTGIWSVTDNVAGVEDGVIAFTNDWEWIAEFQPTNESTVIRSSDLKDIRYKMSFDCPGLYAYEQPPAVPEDWVAAVTTIADEASEVDGVCRFAVVSNGVWTGVQQTAALGQEYEVVIRIDTCTSNIVYSAQTAGGGTLRLATCPFKRVADELMLPMAGSGYLASRSVSNSFAIKGVSQDINLFQVGDDEYEDLDAARAAAGETINIVPLWKSRFVVSGASGKFRVVDNGLLELLWKKWHHYRDDKDGGVVVWSYLSGNNWIEYADASGAVPTNDGGWIVTNEVGLAWIAELATNACVAGTVSLGTDLDLSSKNWTPIAQFSGAFDGRDRTIRGLNNTNVVTELGGVGVYLVGPTNDFGRTAYGLFACTTNASFGNVTFRDVAIDNHSQAIAALVGMHAGGGLAVSNVTIASGEIVGEDGGAVAGIVGTVENWGDLAVVNNTNAAQYVGTADDSGSQTNWVAGILTVGGTNETVGTLVVSGNVNRATVANVVRNDADGGNVAQILAGTTWGTKFGEVVVTNNVADGEVAAEILYHDTGWLLGYYDEWLSKVFPVCNLAPAVTRFTEEDGYRRFVEANSPASVPVDPVYRTARMLAGIFANGWRNFAGNWTDTITTMTNGDYLWITGELLTNDVWETVTVDRSISFDLRGNTICTVYEDPTFLVTRDSQLSISNGTILLPQGAQAFECVGKSRVISNDINVVTMPWDFYGQTVKIDDETATLDTLATMLNFLPSGTKIGVGDSGLDIDTDSNALTYDGTKIATLAGYRSLAPAAAPEGGVSYVLELNGSAVPEFDLQVMRTVSADDGSVAISLSGTRAGLYYAVQRKSSLVEKDWSDASEWRYVATDGEPVSFELPAAESSGFYRVKVTDRAPSGE